MKRILRRAFSGHLKLPRFKRGSAILPAAMRARNFQFVWLAAIFVAALLLRLSLPMDADVSWLLTVGEKWLAGQRVYVDIVETNPPAAFLIYLPAILLGRLLHLAPETLVTAVVFLGSGLSLALARAMGGFRLHGFLCFTLALLVILPADAFAERDHVALIALLPLLVLLAVRAEGRRVCIRLALLAGIGGGIALAIKPHYGLALAPALGLVLWRRANLGPKWLGPEWIALAAVCLLYGALIFAFFPAFLHRTLPLVLAVYQPVTKPGWSLANPSLVIAGGLGAATLLCRPQDAAARIFAVAGLGAALAVILQAKGWPYHGYPAIVLLAMALGSSLPKVRGARLIAAALVLALGLGTGFVWLMTRRDTSRLTVRVAALAPPHPGIIAISPDIALGHPLTRRLGGDWRGTNWGEWVSQDASLLLQRAGLSPQTRATLRTYAAEDRRILARDIAQKRPDVVLVEAGWQGWTFADRGIAAAMKPYRRAAVVGGVGIWLR